MFKKISKNYVLYDFVWRYILDDWKEYKIFVRNIRIDCLQRIFCLVQHLFYGVKVKTTAFFGTDAVITWIYADFGI